MRIYSHIEQELIAKHVLGSVAEQKSASKEKGSRENGSRETGARENASRKNGSLLAAAANDGASSYRPSRAEGAQMIQLMVDLECESKFRELLRWLTDRMPRL